MKYKRILLKLSGEALMGHQNHGIDPIRLNEYASEIKEIQKTGTEIAIVIGGGNIFMGLLKRTLSPLSGDIQRRYFGYTICGNGLASS